MKKFQLLPLTFALGLGLASMANAQSLTELYDFARAYDAPYQSAKAQYDANLYKADQAKASLMPTVNLSAGVTNTQLQIDAAAHDSLPASNTTKSYDTQTSGLNATQPLYRPSNYATYQQGVRTADLAQAQLEAAEQDLIVRVSQTYFDLLGAQDTLTFVQAQKVAVAEQLASAKRNFEVGTATITDTRDAQARYDLVIAQEIAADNDLRVKRLALDILVGKTNISPKPLASPVSLPALVPTDMSVWVQQGQDMHPTIKQSRIALEIAQLEIDKSYAGHKPTLDLNAGYNINRNINGTTISSTDSRTTATTIGLAFNLPLFAGMATQNRLRETLSLEEKARADLETTQRTVMQGTRAAYFGVVSGLGQVKALEAAEASSQSALDANKLGYQVGVKVNIDVLNSQSQLYQTKRDLAKARYDVLVGGLKLKQASGLLTANDLQGVNALLVK